MSKAILIMDDMPSNCEKCSLCKRMEDNCYYCMATNKIIVDVSLKTHWCPLKLLPEKFGLSEYEYRKPENQWQCGWDACIKKMTEQ